MAGVVAGLGSIAGGLAGQALMGKPSVMGPDTSVPGITKATLKKGGKGGAGELNAAQVDPTAALNYFKTAAQGFEQYSSQGLALYGAAMEKAIGELEPIQTAGDTATSQYMRMLGLTDVNGNAGFTGANVTAQLENTPGYQFQLQQGLQATARQALASGDTGGRALAAAQNYGQQVAQNTYQQYLQNLTPLIASGNEATTNISNLYGQTGTTALNTYQNIGQAFYNSTMQQGQTWYDAAKANMQAQNDVMAQSRSQKAALAQTGVASGPGYMNAATNANQFAYHVFQQQQGGQAYYGGNRTGYPTYNPNSNSWSV